MRGWASAWLEVGYHAAQGGCFSLLHDQARSRDGKHCISAGANVDEMSLTLLLSLRFLAVVFEEIRNLALGLAARNLQWKSMGQGAGIQVLCGVFIHPSRLL